MSINKSHFFEKISVFFIYLLIFSTPLVFYTGCYSTFELPKLTFIRTITILLLLCEVVIIIINRRIEFNITPYFLPIFFLLISSFVSTIFSINKIRSISGYYGYFDGEITFLNYILLFYIFSNRINTKKQIDKIFFLIVLSGFFISIYSLVQYFGFEFIPSFKNITNVRIISTLGNPMLLGGYLSIVIPIAIIRFFNSKKIYKIFYSVIISLMFFTLMLTFTRGAYLAFLFSLIFVFLFNREKKKEIIFLLFLFFILFSIFHRERVLIENKSINIVDRVNPADILKSQSVKIRKIIWEDALKIIRENPIFGFGLDNFSSAYDLFGSNRLPSVSGFKNALPEKAHNEILQITTSSGFFGLFCFLWFIVTFIKLNFNRIKSPFSISILSSVIAYIIQSQFSYNTASLNILFWSMAGITSITGNNEKKAYSIKFKNIFLIPICIFIFAFFVFTYFQFKADIHFNLGFLSSQKKLYKNARQEYEKAVKLNHYEENYHNALGLIYIETKNKNLAISEFEKVLEINPKSATAYNNLGLIYLDENKIDKSILMFKYAIKCSKSIPDIYFNLGDAYLKSKDIKSAITEYKKGLKIYPHDLSARIKLADMHYQLKDFDSAILEYKEILKINPSLAYVYNNLGLIQTKKKDFSSAIKNFKKAIELNKNATEPYINLAYAYYKIGRKNEAIFELKKVLKINPDNKIAKFKIKKLKEK